MKKILARQLILKNIHAMALKKFILKEFDNEKKFLRLEKSPPPSHNFSNGPSLRACLHGRGGPQMGEVLCGGSHHLSCKRDEIKMRDYVDRRVTHQSGLPHLPGVPHLHVNRP